MSAPGTFTPPPGEVAHRLRAALAAHQAGHVDQAEAGYRAILRLAPAEPDALNLLGVLLQQRGALPASIALLERAIAAAPDFAEAMTNLARARRLSGDAGAAAELARRALALDPDLAEAHLNLGQALIALGNDAGGAIALREADRLAPQPAVILNALGRALICTNDATSALDVLSRAQALAPERAEIMANLAIALTRLDRFEEALIWQEKATALAPDHPLIHAVRAITLSRQNQPKAAIAACRRALQSDPGQDDIRLLLAHNLARLGQFAEAETHCRDILARDPGATEASHQLAAIGRSADDADQTARLGAVAANPAAAIKDRIAAGMALGRTWDQAGDYDKAFAAFAGANRLIRASLAQSGVTGDQVALDRYVDWAMTRFTQATCTADATLGDPSDLPVFIVGMPRSGTTLVEQIAASHSQVFGAGELKSIARLLSGLDGEAGYTAPGRWDRSTARAAAAAHVAHLRRLGGDAARVIDKLPDNAQVLGQIAALFPGSRVIICRRDPRDVCLSCYFQHFADPMPWTTDQGALAMRATAIDRLLNHWRAVLPLRILEMRYETLVADLEGESRRLIAFLGLEWEPACLAFHETRRPVATASLWQVRQPLYASSVGRWRHYRKHLQPLLDGLRALVPAED